MVTVPVTSPPVDSVRSNLQTSGTIPTVVTPFHLPLIVIVGVGSPTLQCRSP